MNLLPWMVNIRRWLICRVFREFIYEKFGVTLDFLYEKFMGVLLKLQGEFK